MVNDEIAEFVRSVSRTGDRMFNFGVDAQLYFLADREPATYYARPLASFHTRPSSFAHTMAELRARPPAVIVDGSRMEAAGSVSPIYDQRGVIEVKPEYRAPFADFLAEFYRFAGRVEYTDVYVLR
jgi:hypothetical protein